MNTDQMLPAEKSYQYQQMIAATATTLLPKWEDTYEDQEAEYRENREQFADMQHDNTKSFLFWVRFMILITIAAIIIITIFK